MRTIRLLSALIFALFCWESTAGTANAQQLQGSVKQDEILDNSQENLRIPRPNNQINSTSPLSSSDPFQSVPSQGNGQAITGYADGSQNSAGNQGQVQRFDGTVNSQQQIDAQHGESHMGVLGAVCNMMTGQIWQILPGSDLNQFGIHPGDKFLGIDGHKFSPFSFVKRCHGTPGSIMQITVLHDGQVVTVPVRRMDGREAYRENPNLPRGPWANNYRWAASQNQYW